MPKAMTKLGRLLGDDLEAGDLNAEVTRMVVLLKKGHELYALAITEEERHYDASSSDFARWCAGLKPLALTMGTHPTLEAKPLGTCGCRFKVCRRVKEGEESLFIPPEVLTRDDMRAALVTLFRAGLKRVCVVRNGSDYLVWY